MVELFQVFQLEQLCTFSIFYLLMIWPGRPNHDIEGWDLFSKNSISLLEEMVIWASQLQALQRGETNQDVCRPTQPQTLSSRPILLSGRSYLGGIPRLKRSNSSWEHTKQRYELGK